MSSPKSVFPYYSLIAFRFVRGNVHRFRINPQFRGKEHVRVHLINHKRDTQPNFQMVSLYHGRVPRYFNEYPPESGGARTLEAVYQ